MGACASTQQVAEAPPDLGPFPMRGKKMRTDATLKEVYRVGGTIGCGGFSKVKIVTHRETKQQYACKIMTLPPADSACKEERAARKDTLREIDAVLDLDHPNVVGMREYFVQNNNVYLIMELLRGGELLDAVNNQGHYSEADARTIFCQLMAGIRYLHSKNIVHRDLKLDNLLLANKDDISALKIADFGIARKEGSVSGLSQLKTVCGTTQYIAPEVIAAGRKKRPDGTVVRNVYGPECDLWSAGVILFMLLSGRPPFWDDSQPRMLRSIAAGKFSFSDPVWKGVSRQAKDLISRLLVVNPAKRLTCEQVLAHSWMKGCKPCGTGRSLAETLTRMKSGSLSGRRRAESQPLHSVIADVSVRAATSFLLDTPSASMDKTPSMGPTPLPSTNPTPAPSVRGD